MARKKKAPAIGIDLGTTCSSVAVWKDGRVWVIQDEEGNISIPSYVALTHRRILIGTAAADQAAFNPKNTIFDVKRLIGRRFTDQFTERDRERWPFEVIAAGEKPMIVVKEKQFFPEEITAMIVGKMKYIAEAYLGKRVKQAVITVPAHFTDSQRQATKDAGAIAGLKVLRIINEPTAAALAYGLDKKNSTSGARNVLIFDLGGGTFDVSILGMEEGIFKVKATAGDSHLGGEDFDNRMVDHFVKKFKEENDKDITGDFTALSKLRAACEKAKKTLSWYDDTTLEIHSLFQGIGLNATITRKKFEELNEHLFNRCMELVNRCLKDVNMKKSGIDEIVLVGGSTRIPKIKELLEDNFNGIPFCKSQRNEAVCYGAALQAAMLQKVNQVPDVVTVDVTPLSIGIETAQGKIDVVISRNEQIPISVEWMLTPESNKIYESDGRRWSRYKNLLGAIELNSRSSDPCIKVSFEIDVDGILSIKAEKKCIPIDKARLSRSEITKMAVEAVREVQEYKMKVAAKKYFQDYVFSKRERIEFNNLESYIEKAIDRLFVLHEILDEDSLHDYLPLI